MQTFVFRQNMEANLTSLRIEGSRIRLLSVAEDHSSDIFREFTSDISRFMLPNPPARLEDARLQVTGWLQGMRGGRDLVLVVVGKVDGEFLGCCGLLPKETPRTPEVGIWIKKGAQGRKYGREAVETLAAWAKASLDLEYLVYPVDKANAPSRKIPEALGGVLLHEMQVCKPNGETLDLVVYKIHPSADSAI